MVPVRFDYTVGLAKRAMSVVRETAPTIGSDESSDDSSSSRNRQKQAVLKARVRRCDRELRRFRAEYDSEVRECADLREELESGAARQAEALLPAKTQLREAQEALSALNALETRSLMHIEDDLGHSGRLIQAREREIQFLERRLHGLQSSCHSLLQDDGGMPDTAAEEALRASDMEVSELQSDVQQQENHIACLSSDVKSVLDYMMIVNIDAAGGPSKDLAPEDFLPSEVRNHLNLSEHGKSHLSILLKKYEIFMAECEGGALHPASKITSSGIDCDIGRSMDYAINENHSGRGHAVFGNPPHQEDISQSIFSLPDPFLEPQLLSACKVPKHFERTAEKTVPSSLPGPIESGLDSLQDNTGEPRLTSEQPLVAACMEEGDSAEWAWCEDETIKPTAKPSPANYSLRSSETIPGDASRPSFAFKDEADLLREGLAMEMQELSDIIAFHGSASRKDPDRHLLCATLCAAARGDEVELKASLRRAAESGEPGDSAGILGWTPWHVAAAYGQGLVLECLKEDVVERHAHHLVALSRPTAMGLPPLGVACVRGQVEAVRSLLLGMAPVGRDVRDPRGNTPLLWAIAGGRGEILAPLLLEAGADAAVANNHGHTVADVAAFLAGGGEGGRPGLATLPPAATTGLQVARDTRSDDIVICEPFHQIFAIGAQPALERSLLSLTIGMLRAPQRDVVGFSKNEKGKSLARLSGEEAEMGVYSDWVINYTHAGLQNTLEAGRPSADPTLPDRCRQALVLTCERILLFNVNSWSLVQVIALSELMELVVSSYSETVVLLRMHRMADVVLDCETRPRLLDEMQLASHRVAERWGGVDFSGGATVRNESEPISPLFDEWQSRIGTLAYVDTAVFLLLPFEPGSVLLSLGDPFFFGFLECHQSMGASLGAAGCKWTSYLFILKSGPGPTRRLSWCRHPNDVRSVGYVLVKDIHEMQPLDTPEGGACLIVNYQDSNRPRALTLRAPSLQNREDWITSLRAMQTGS